jgi:MerR family transcriptional regulator/heat shock protein HspR
VNDGLTPKYMIGVAAALVGMHPQTLRLYESRGLVQPRRSAGGTRLYCDADLVRLRRIGVLTGELGLTLAGVERVLELEDTVSRLRDRVAQLESKLDAMEVHAERRVAEAHRSYRRELVLWRPPSQSLTHRRSTST